MDAIGFERLTEGQKECLRLFHARFEVKDIARRIGRSPVTVHQRLAAARKHLGVDRSVEAARLLAEYEARTETSSQGADSSAGIAEAEAHPTRADLQAADRPQGVEVLEASKDLSASRASDAGWLYSSPIYGSPMLGEAVPNPAKGAPERPGIQALPLPFPTRDRPVNDMSFGLKLTYVVVLAALIALVFGGMVAALTGLSELF